MSDSAGDRIAALLAYCDEIDAKSRAAWEDYSRWIEGRASSAVPMSVPKLDTKTVRRFLAPSAHSSSPDTPTQGC
jgi:hypothetical protein